MSGPRLRMALLLLPLGAAGCASDSYAPEEVGVPLHFAVSGPEAVSVAETAALGAAFDMVDSYAIEIVDDGSEASIAATTIPVAAGLDVHRLDVAVPEDVLGRTVRITLVAYGGKTEFYRGSTITTLSETNGTIVVDLQVRYTGPGVRGIVVDDLGNGVADVTVNLYRDDVIVDAVQTEPDGTYLFLDLVPGAHSVVVPTPNRFSSVCPGVRAVTVATVQDAIVADFEVSDVSCGNNVLVVSGGDFDDTAAVEAILAGDPDLTTDSWFFVNQPPTLQDLRRYDAVVLFSNGLFDESVGLGNRIAEYVDQGGNLVVASFYWQVRSGSALGAGWGALEALDPFESRGGATYQLGVVDGIDDPTHPLAFAVQSVTSTGFWGGVSAKSTTNIVATWANGDPLIGYRVLPGGQRIVGVSLFPASGVSATGDWQQVFLNAAAWTGEAGGPVTRLNQASAAPRPSRSLSPRPHTR